MKVSLTPRAVAAALKLNLILSVAGREDGLVFAVAVCTGLHKGGMNEELANENCLAAATRYKTWRSAFCSTAALCSAAPLPAP